MKRFVFALLLLCAPQWAQEKPAEKPTEHLVITLKYISPSALNQLLQTYSNMGFRYNEEMKVIALAGPKDVVDAAAAMIRQFDVPPKDIDLTVYYMVGSEAEGNLGTPPPKELDPVVAQLKNAFTFRNYRLLDVLVLRTRTGEQASSNANLGMVTAPNGSLQPIIGQFSMHSATLAPDGSTVRLDGLKNSLRWPTPSGMFVDLNLNTDIDIKEGQKVVVGRLGISHDQALFLVLTAKVVN